MNHINRIIIRNYSSLSFKRKIIVPYHLQYETRDIENNKHMKNINKYIEYSEQNSRYHKNKEKRIREFLDNYIKNKNIK